MSQRLRRISYATTGLLSLMAGLYVVVMNPFSAEVGDPVDANVLVFLQNLDILHRTRPPLSPCTRVQSGTAVDRSQIGPRDPKAVNRVCCTVR